MSSLRPHSPRTRKYKITDDKDDAEDFPQIAWTLCICTALFVVAIAKTVLPGKNLAYSEAQSHPSITPLQSVVQSGSFSEYFQEEVERTPAGVSAVQSKN
ncbi:MAG: hypothetical protein CL678_18420 [Bdellovibrionaceae bacterium]|nr:hypothetical protein [Pseudobdellovibrionaceae bacterium]|tara:strand:- start:654 stop:953 length:300 start_codon:yes stop_codon:yes gene_type:complete